MEGRQTHMPDAGSFPKQVPQELRYCESTGQTKSPTRNSVKEQVCSPSLSLEVKRRRWKWIGHVCIMPLTSIPRVAMRWTPGGKRARGRPKETWRRSVERETKALGWSWGQVTKLATDRQHWRSFVSALCVIPHEED